MCGTLTEQPASKLGFRSPPTLLSTALKDKRCQTLRPLENSWIIRNQVKGSSDHRGFLQQLFSHCWKQQAQLQAQSGPRLDNEETPQQLGHEASKDADHERLHGGQSQLIYLSEGGGGPRNPKSQANKTKVQENKENKDQ